MKVLISLLTPALDFVHVNLYKIIVAVAVTATSFLVFYLTAHSLRKLKMEVLPYYPFDRFFPQSGTWSVLYFLIVVIFLGALAYLLAKGGFYLSPA